MGLFGGLIGEMIIFIQSLQDLSNEGIHSGLKQLFTSTESLDELIVAVLTSLIAYE